MRIVIGSGSVDVKGWDDTQPRLRLQALDGHDRAWRLGPLPTGVHRVVLATGVDVEIRQGNWAVVQGGGLWWFGGDGHDISVTDFSNDYIAWSYQAFTVGDGDALARRIDEAVRRPVYVRTPVRFKHERPAAESSTDALEAFAQPTAFVRRTPELDAAIGIPCRCPMLLGGGIDHVKGCSRR